MMINKKVFILIVSFIFSLSTLSIAAHLDVSISNIKNANGKVVLALYNNEDSFPKKGNEYLTASLIITSSNIVHRFESIPSGNYAAVSFHDENLNKKLDKRFGKPIESFGFSNGAVPKLGPPKFSAAMFFVTENKTTTINIKLKK